MWRKRSSILILTFILSIGTTFAADPVPGCSLDPDDDGYDPNGCPVPLDTWIYILVIAAVIFGAYKLFQKQKALAA